MKTTLQKIDTFYHTPWIYITSIGLVWIVSIIFGFLPFAMDANATMEWGWGNKLIVRQTPNAWLGWLILSFSLIGATLAVSGEISIANNSKKYVWPISIARIFIITYCILVKLWFLAATSLLYAVIGIINARNWDDKGTILRNNMTPKSYFIVGLVTIAFLSFGLGTTLGENPLIYDPLPIMDVLFSCMVIYGWLNISHKNKWGWIIYVMSDFGFITLYLMMGNMSFVTSSSIYFVFDTIATVRWFNWGFSHDNFADSIANKYLK